MEVDLEDIVIISNRAGLEFSKKVIKELKKKNKDFRLADYVLEDFNNGEIFFKSNTNLRGKGIYTINLFKDINKDFFESLIINDALLRAGADKITVVCPFMPYQRQDKKDEGRVPITAKLMFDLIATSCGAPSNNRLSRIITADLHADQEQGFWNGPVDNLEARYKFVDYFKDKFDADDIVIVSPDAGGAKRARYFAKILKTNYAIANKIREAHGKCSSWSIIGEVENKIPVLVDDIIDTGGSVVETIRILKEKYNTKKEAYVCATHGIFSKDGKGIRAEEKLAKCDAKVLITDTIPKDKEYLNKNKSWLEIVSMAPLFAEVLYRTMDKESVSELFEKYQNL